MDIEWTRLFEKISSNPKAGKSGLRQAAEVAAQRLSGGDVDAKNAWLAVGEASPSQLPKRVMKALQLSGLPLTFNEDDWRRLLRQDPFVVPDGPDDDLFHNALEIGATRVNDIEWPPMSNLGNDIAPYQKAAGNADGSEWCMAFVYWCMGQAARAAEAVNPLKATGSCLKQWEHAQSEDKHAHGALSIITASQALGGRKVPVGAIFIHHYEGAHGHTGFVAEVKPNGDLVTLEGNSNPIGVSGLGLGVFRGTHRKLGDAALQGFIVTRNHA